MPSLAGPMGLVLAFCYAVLAGVVWSTRRNTRSTGEIADRIAELVRQKRWDEARIEARRGGATTRGLLGCLREERWDFPPPLAGVLGSGLAVFLAGSAPLAVALGSGAGPASRWVEALWVFGLVLPAAGGVAAFIVVQWRVRWAVLRGRALVLLAEQLEVQLERDRAEALQRGWVARDPRGE